MNNELRFDKWYSLAEAYYNYHGNSKIKFRFKTKNGYEYDKDGYCLGIWVSNIRVLYKNAKLSQERIDKLEKIGFRFEANYFDLEWNKMYKLLRNYYNWHKNTEININFKTVNGYEYNENGYALGAWVHGLRALYKEENLSQDRIEKLKKIGFRFETNYYHLEWEKMYELASIYYQKYGNSNVIQNFKTINGYEYDENGYSLGLWITTQRKLYRLGNLDLKRYEKLKKIDFMPYINDNKQEKINLCNNHGINYKKYKNLIDSINYKEFLSKIYYLLDIRKEIVDINGKINRIFFMNSDTLKLVTGFTTDELIDYYYHCYMIELIDNYYTTSCKKRILV